MGDSLNWLDLAVIGVYVAFALAVGSLFSRRAGTSYESFFVGDRKLPWWIAGTSIVATTFAADTPLAVTGIVALDGISGNWIWWCWAIAHLVSTFFFARLWRRSNVLTNAEITELRYSGRAASGLRAFKAVYYGIFINCLTMAWVIAAMVKISRAFFEVEPGWVIAGCVLVSVSYTVLGGYRSVVVTDLVQFGLGVGGAVLLAVLCLRRIGGVGSLPGTSDGGSGLLGELAAAIEGAGHRAVADVLDFVPRADHPTLPAVYFVVLLVAGWWQYAEGNGYIVQRLASCRDEAEAQAASLWFTVAHNSLRPWPWIVVALASLVFYPSLPGEAQPTLQAAVEGRTVEISPTVVDVATGATLEIAELPSDCAVEIAGRAAPIVRLEGIARVEVDAPGEVGRLPLALRCGGRVEPVGELRAELTDREMGYPLMMRGILPHGWLGLVVASLIAAFMSTIDTHTNWGSSYLVQDLYRRFLKPGAPAKHYVFVSRVCIVLMAALAGVSALFVTDIATVWRFLVTLGAGLGSVAAVRWFWPRVTAYAELAAMATTTFVAVGLELTGAATVAGFDNPLYLGALPAWLKIVLIAAASMATWIPVSLFGPPNDEETLRRFARQVRPPGRAWAPYRDAPGDPISPMVQRLLAGAVVVFAALFGIGDLVLGWRLRGGALVLIALFVLLGLARSGATTERTTS